MSNATACSQARAIDPCSRCDLLLGLDGVHVEQVERGPTSMAVTITTPWQLMGCPGCGVVAVGRGRRLRVLHDVPGQVGVRLRWRQRSWRCQDPGCPIGTFMEQIPTLVAARGSITRRAIEWAIQQLRSEHATIAGLARQLGTSWKSLWRVVKPRLQEMADDPARFAGVVSLGVDEHLWHHVDVRKRGPKELTGMVDLTRDVSGRVQARLLDLVPGRSGRVYADWLQARGNDFRDRVQIAALDPFAGYKRAVDDELEDATVVLDAFHVVALSTKCVDEVRRRVQQETTGHRGRKGDPLFGIQTILRAGADKLTDRQVERLVNAINADERHEEVYLAWRCAQDLRAAYRDTDLPQGRRRAEALIVIMTSCPIPEVARLGRTLRRWKEPFLAYFTTGRSSNGGTEAVNGIIELHRRLARGYRNLQNYRLRMLLVAGGLTP